MENETKKIEKTEGIANGTFLQPEPAQLNEADLQQIAGGANCDTNCCSCWETKDRR